MSRGVGTLQKKILLLLLGGLALGFSGSPGRYFRITRMIGKEWERIDREALRRAIKRLYASKLVSEKYNKDGTVTLILSGSGRTKALTYNLDEIKILEPKRWDGKWRIVAFDIPEPFKKMRDAFRLRLLQIGMKEFQKSLFVFPHPCDDEVDFLIEFFQIRPYVRKIIAETFDNEIHFRQKFHLPK